MPCQRQCSVGTIDPSNYLGNGLICFLDELIDTPFIPVVSIHSSIGKKTNSRFSKTSPLTLWGSGIWGTAHGRLWVSDISQCCWDLPPLNVSPDTCQSQKLKQTNIRRHVNAFTFHNTARWIHYYICKFLPQSFCHLICLYGDASSNRFGCYFFSEALKGQALPKWNAI